MYDYSEFLLPNEDYFLLSKNQKNIEQQNPVVHPIKIGWEIEENEISNMPLLNRASFIFIGREQLFLSGTSSAKPKQIIIYYLIIIQICT